jgi:hypothetical protein
MNTNYKKNFVPYKQALALKKLGFDEICLAWYNSKGQLLAEITIGYEQTDFFYTQDDMEENQCIAPTFFQAFRWFRQKHNIDAWVQPFVSEKQNGKPFLPDESYAYYIFEDGVYVADGVNFLDSEEAELECLKKLIEIVKKQL